MRYSRYCNYANGGYSKGLIMKLKDFRKSMKELGYSVKAKTVSFQDLARDQKLFVSVFDGKTLVNAGIMNKSHFEKYKTVFDILNNNTIVK